MGYQSTRPPPDRYRPCPVCSYFLTVDDIQHHPACPRQGWAPPRWRPTKPPPPRSGLLTDAVRQVSSEIPEPPEPLPPARVFR